MKKFTNKKLFHIETDNARLVTLDKISLYCSVNDENFYPL